MKDDKNYLTMRHGGPWDRGSADAYYKRPFNPHYFTGDTYNSDLIKEKNMTEKQIEDYKVGYGKYSWIPVSTVNA